MRLPSPPDVCVYGYGRLKWPASVHAGSDTRAFSVSCEQRRPRAQAAATRLTNPANGLTTPRLGQI